MNLTVIYWEARKRYQKAPTWESFFALVGAILLKWPLLSKRPLSCQQLESFAEGLGIEIWETELTICHGLATSFELPGKQEKVSENTKKDVLEPSLYQDKETFNNIIRFVKEGGGRVILIKPNLSEKRKAFILAHELAHHLLGHIDSNCQVKNYLAELHCDVFASWLTGIDSPWRPREEQRLIRKILGSSREPDATVPAPRHSTEFKIRKLNVGQER